MIHWKANQLSNKETYEINRKHKSGENELSSEPCMDSIGYSALTTTEIVTKIWRNNSQEPMNKSFSLKNNKKCQQEEKRKCRDGWSNTRGKRQTHSRELTRSFLDKFFDSVDVSYKIIHEELSTIFVRDKCRNTRDINLFSDKSIEIEWESIENWETSASLKFKGCYRSNNVWFRIFSKTDKYGNNRYNKKGDCQENSEESNQNTEHVRDFPFTEFHNKRSEKECKEARNQKQTYQISEQIGEPERQSSN